MHADFPRSILQAAADSLLEALTEALVVAIAEGDEDRVKDLQREGRAMQKACDKLDAGYRPTLAGPTTYRFASTSRDGASHLYSLDHGCSCEAATLGVVARPCYHGAIVAILSRAADLVAQVEAEQLAMAGRIEIFIDSRTAEYGVKVDGVEACFQGSPVRYRSINAASKDVLILVARHDRGRQVAADMAELFG
jgi:hypothetical protein